MTCWSLVPMGPNPQQQKLIESSRGIYLVDAGAGTGKTYALVRRYAHLLETEKVDPADLLFITFTTSAAEEMKERVLNLCGETVSPLALEEAPISTFHSLCNRLLKQYGFEAPAHLGFKQGITPSTRVLENNLLEENKFRRFLDDFLAAHPEYESFFTVLNRREALLDLIKSLAAKGIFPTQKNGEKDWYQHGEAYLDGDLSRFRELVEPLNSPGRGSRGPTQAELLKRAKGAWRNKCFPPSAPEKNTLAGGEHGKIVSPELLEKAFGENREKLKQFLHDLYFSYVSYCLREDYLNFGFLMMFAYVLLCESPQIRAANRHRFVMVDEFQDTSEIQFKLTLLLSQTNNICVVGDWKQSIYSFQYASVENIQQFETRLKQYKQELNADASRVDYPVDNVDSIPLVQNYRSSQEILDFARHGLTLPGRKSEDLDSQKILSELVDLEAQRQPHSTTIQGLESEAETEAILEKIQSLVENPEYKITHAGEPELIGYEDIAVLTRNRNFGLRLQEKAREYNLPVAYEGGLELFKTDPAILLLAWLRVLEDKNSERGWAVILEEAGYNLAELKAILGSEEETGCFDRCPGQFKQFREELLSLDNGSFHRWIAALSHRIFSRYDCHDPIADRLIEVLYSTALETRYNLGELVNFIEANIEADSVYEVSNNEENTVTVQTIHSAKGLEYPVVFVADVNSSHFPGRGGRRPVIDYHDPLGLRQKKHFRREPVPYVYDNWRATLLHRTLSGRYDEERRLIYVAMTRARDYLFLTAKPDKTSPFFENLREKMEVEHVEAPEPEEVAREHKESRGLEYKPVSHSGRLKLSVHDIMTEPGEAEAGRGAEFGRKLHNFAEKYAAGNSLEPDNEDQRHVCNWLEDQLNSAEPLIEKSCLLPFTLPDLEVLLAGTIDLVLVGPEKIQVIDYKTDLDRTREPEYKKQLSVYYHVIAELYPERQVVPQIFYTTEPTPQPPFEPLTLSELKESVTNTLNF